MKRLGFRGKRGCFKGKGREAGGGAPRRAPLLCFSSITVEERGKGERNERWRGMEGGAKEEVGCAWAWWRGVGLEVKKKSAQKQWRDFSCIYSFTKRRQKEKGQKK